LVPGAPDDQKSLPPPPAEDPLVSFPLLILSVVPPRFPLLKLVSARIYLPDSPTLLFCSAALHPLMSASTPRVFSDAFYSGCEALSPQFCSFGLSREDNALDQVVLFSSLIAYMA